MLQCYNAGLGYSTLGTIRSSLSHIVKIDNKPVGQHYLVCLFLKAVAQERPALSRNATWEINDVLTYLRTLGPAHVLSLEMLTKKMLMLMAILSGQRGQTLHALTTSRMTKTELLVTFYIDEPLKTSRPGHHHGVVRFMAFPTDINLCVVTHIYEYLE